MPVVALSFVAVPPAEGKVCMRARPTFCTMVNWQANVSAVAAAGKAELDLAVEVSGQPASEKCKSYYADMRCRQIYPKCDPLDSSKVDQTVCRSECDWFKERCLTVQLDCSAFPQTGCYAGPHAGGFMAAPSMLVTAAVVALASLFM